MVVLGGWAAGCAPAAGRGARLRGHPPDEGAAPRARSVSPSSPRILDVDASTVSRQVRHLEDRGLLERTSDPDDGRASRIALSERGPDPARGGRAPSPRAFVAQLLETWPDEDREQLRLLLNRLLDELDHHQETP